MSNDSSLQLDFLSHTFCPLAILNASVLVSQTSIAGRSLLHWYVTGSPLSRPALHEVQISDDRICKYSIADNVYRLLYHHQCISIVDVHVFFRIGMATLSRKFAS